MFGAKPRDTSAIMNTEIETLRHKLARAEQERDAAQMKLAELRPIMCSFCAKTQHEVKKMIAGPSVYICNECVDLCVQIVSEAARPTTGDTDDRT